MSGTEPIKLNGKECSACGTEHVLCSYCRRCHKCHMDKEHFDRAECEVYLKLLAVK